MFGIQYLAKGNVLVMRLKMGRGGRDRQIDRELVKVRGEEKKRNEGGNYMIKKFIEEVERKKYKVLSREKF